MIPDGPYALQALAFLCRLESIFGNDLSSQVMVRNAEPIRTAMLLYLIDVGVYWIGEGKTITSISMNVKKSVWC